MEMLMKQKEDLFKENEDNLADFEEKLTSRFNRSLEISEDLEQWKNDADFVLRFYMNNKRQVKQAFQIINSENEKKLGIQGQEYKEKLVNAMNHTQKCMEQYLVNYKLEMTFPLNTKAFALHNPRLDLESLLFNIEINPIDQYNLTTNINIADLSDNKDITNNYDVSLQDNKFPKDVPTNSKEAMPSRREDNLLTDISIVDLPDLENSKPPRELPPPKGYNINPSTTTQRFLLRDRSFTKVEDQPANTYTISNKNLPIFKRNLSPTSIKDVHTSPKRKKRISLNDNLAEGTLANRSPSKKNLLLNEYKTFNPKGRSNKSFTNITDNPGTNNKKREPSSGTVLKKLMGGRHGDILVDLKKNVLTSLDLSFAGNFNRFKRCTYSSD